MKWLEPLASMIFPVRCAYCNKVQKDASPVCTRCAVLAQAISRDMGSVVDTSGRTLAFVQYALAPYMYIEPVKGAILRLKFGERTQLAKFFAKRLILELGACKSLPEFDIIIPIPSGKGESRRRGYNVPVLLAQEISDQSGIPLALASLTKPKDIERQMRLSGARRRANVLGAFTVSDVNLITGKNILLVDDVLTTGATINECAKMLMVCGAQSCCGICIAIASIAK